MTGGNWTPALLMVAAALALAIAPTRFRWPALLALLASAAAAAIINYPASWQPMLLAGSWLSVAVTAFAVYRQPDTSLLPPLLLALNAGGWAGAVTASGNGNLLRILPLILLALPAGWIAARGAVIALKFLASWLIAISILVVALPMVATPGYVQDHMD